MARTWLHPKYCLETFDRPDRCQATKKQATSPVSGPRRCTSRPVRKHARLLPSLCLPPLAIGDYNGYVSVSTLLWTTCAQLGTWRACHTPTIVSLRFEDPALLHHNCQSQPPTTRRPRTGTRDADRVSHPCSTTEDMRPSPPGSDN